MAMKNLIVQLWSTVPIPSSYFGLVEQVVDALPWIEAVKRSTCVEGSRMAFARSKIQWAKMKATEVATAGPHEGKDLRTPERYFDDILEGAREIEGQCSKDAIFD